MIVRTSHKTVTFTQPFALSGIDEVQAAGTYTVETNEEPLQGVSFPAYRRMETLIFLPSRPGRALVERVVNIDPLELEAAQKRDASIAALEGRGMRWPASPDHENNLSEEHRSGADPAWSGAERGLRERQRVRKRRSASAIWRSTIGMRIAPRAGSLASADRPCGVAAKEASASSSSASKRSTIALMA